MSLNVNLIAAVKENDAKAVESILTVFSRPVLEVNKIETVSGNTALIFAVLYNHIDIVKIFLRLKGLSFNKQNNEGMSALVIAVTHGHMEITKLLLEQSSVHVNIRTDLSSSKWYAGYTPLMFAIYNCHFCVANALLDHFDVNVNLLNEEGNTALMLAVDLEQTEIVDILLRRPDVDVTVINKKGSTALMLAVKVNNKELVDAILRRPDVDIRVINASNHTAWSLAHSDDVRNAIQNHATKHAKPSPMSQSHEDTRGDGRVNVVHVQPNWLAAHLLKHNLDGPLWRECENKLIELEGFAVESDFAESEIDAAYLSSIGITARGVQHRLLSLHRSLQGTLCADTEASNIGATNVQLLSALDAQTHNLAILQRENEALSEQVATLQAMLDPTN